MEGKWTFRDCCLPHLKLLWESLVKIINVKLTRPKRVIIFFIRSTSIWSVECRLNVVQIQLGLIAWNLKTLFFIDYNLLNKSLSRACSIPWTVLGGGCLDKVLPIVDLCSREISEPLRFCSWNWYPEEQGELGNRSQTLGGRRGQAGRENEGR